MTDHASLELCKELYELSGWDDTNSYWYLEHQIRLSNGNYDTLQTMLVDKHYRAGTSPKTNFIPAYTAGYLLRKLPRIIKSFEYHNHTLLLHPDDDLWIVGYYEKWATKLVVKARLSLYADTPENALCKLAIELFNQNILKKGV